MIAISAAEELAQGWYSSTRRCKLSMTVGGQVELDSTEPEERSFWERPETEREATFAALRRDDPIRFFPEAE